MEVEWKGKLFWENWWFLLTLSFLCWRERLARALRSFFCWQKTRGTGHERDARASGGELFDIVFDFEEYYSELDNKTCSEVFTAWFILFFYWRKVGRLWQV